ncbi:MAG: hypothetical protein ACP5NZ_04825 [Nanobdellota archaeon]
MENCGNNEFRDLEKGLYQFQNSEELLYFTGEYEQGLAVFEDEKGEPRVFFSNRLNDFYKLSKEEIKDKIKESPEKASWIEKMLKG